MKLSSLIVFIAGAVWVADIAAQGQSVVPEASPPPSSMANGSPAYIPSSVGTNSLPSGMTFGSGSLTYIGGTGTVPYGSGKHPNLQSALVDLSDAFDNLNRAHSADKGDYLLRAMMAVQMAIADVKYTLDDDDGVPPPPESSLPSLPPGVGNPSSGLKVVLKNNLRFTSPDMDKALADLTKVQGEFNIAVHWTPPVFMARAVADVNFAVDNVNAAVNVANGYPATQPNAGAGPTPPSPVASAPEASINMAEIIGAIVIIVVLIGIIAEQVMVRAKGRSLDG